MFNNFGIAPPWYENPIEYVAFNSYVFHQQQIEDFINELAATSDPNDAMTQQNIATTLGICINHLTEDEIQYIEQEIANRYNSL